MFLFCTNPRFYHFRCWNRNSIWFTNHWLCQEPISQTTIVHLCHLGFCPFRGYGTVLPFDGLLITVCILSLFLVKIIFTAAQKYLATTIHGTGTHLVFNCCKQFLFSFLKYKKKTRC